MSHPVKTFPYDRVPMKISTKNLLTKITIAILGNEEWLSTIYKTFTVDNKIPGTATGSVTIMPEPEYDRYLLEGHFEFSPMVSCNLCSLPIAWPLTLKFSVYFKNQPKTLDLPVRDRQLTKEELDQYFVENQAIDLEQFLNEQIHLSIPIRTVKASEDESHCVNCLEPLGSGAIYSTGGQKVSVFSILNRLKTE